MNTQLITFLTFLSPKLFPPNCEEDRQESFFFNVELLERRRGYSFLEDSKYMKI